MIFNKTILVDTKKHIKCKLFYLSNININMINTQKNYSENILSKTLSYV